MEQQFIKEQKKLFQKIDLNNHVDASQIEYIAGADLAYWKVNEKEYAVCCIVIIDYKSKKIVEEKYAVDEVKIPYIPGCLAFREIPLVLKTVDKLECVPDVYVFDGNGYLHPRHMGLATHAGILLDKPSIGIAKTYYKISDEEYIQPANEPFAYRDIIINNEIYGRVVRTHKDVKPVFVSIGNKINMDITMEIVKEMTTKESHIPIPTRYADIMTHKIRKEQRINRV